VFEPFPNTVGGDADLMIDPNYLFNPVQAKLLCRAVEDCNITWFEGAFAPTRCPSARRPAHTYENTACCRADGRSSLAPSISSDPTHYGRSCSVSDEMVPHRQRHSARPGVNNAGAGLLERPDRPSKEGPK